MEIWGSTWKFGVAVSCSHDATAFKNTISLMSDKFPMLNVMSLSSFFRICVLPQVCGMTRFMHSFSKFLLYAFNL